MAEEHRGFTEGDHEFHCSCVESDASDIEVEILNELLLFLLYDNRNLNS